MTDPTDPTVPNPDAQPTQAYPEVHPTQGYPDAQPTQAYPDARPTQAYPSAPPAPGYPVTQQTQGYGQPTQAYGQPAPGAPGPKQPDTRPKTLAWVGLSAGVLGLVLVLVSFIPLVWVSLGLALVGGVLLLAGLIIGIVAVANRKQGGKGVGVAAIIVSVLGGVAWIAAITWALVIIGLSAAGASAPAPSESTGIESEAPAETDESTDAAGAYDETAYLDQVRPELVAIMQELDPAFTDELLGQMFPDDTLVSTGKGFLVVGDAARETFVQSLGGSGVFTEEQATRFYDAILTAAEDHLVE